MSRTPLLTAAVLALATVGLGVGVAPAHAATSSVPSIRVVGPCFGGGGTISARSYRTSDGGVAVQTRITGVAPGSRWQGLTFVGQPTLDDESDVPVTKADDHGVVTATLRSEKSWPRFSGGIYFRSDYGAVCEAIVGTQHAALAGVVAPLATVVRPVKRAVRVFDFGVRKGTHWRVKVALTGPAGTTRLSRVATAGKEGYDVRFGHVAHLRGVTHVSVRAVNLANGKVHWLRVTRSS